MIDIKVKHALESIDSKSPTLRDQFAMAALTSLIGNIQAINEARKKVVNLITIENVLSEMAYKQADAMLAEREKMYCCGIDPAKKEEKKEEK